MGYDSLVASLTFLAVAGRKVQLEIFKHFAVPINLERVLHRDQKISSTGRYSPATSCGSTPTSTRSSRRTAPWSPRSAVRSPTTTASRCITSIVTVIGEAAHDDEADEVSATIAARRDAAIAKMIAGQSSKS